MSIDSEINTIIEQNNKIYRLSAQYLSPESFSVQIISEDWTIRYASEFSSSFIEKTTSKSGSFKRLPVFWKMFFLACQKLENTKPLLTIEILTSAQLQQFVTFPVSESLIESQSELDKSTTKDNKLFLIVTQISDFDKTRYLLPLIYTPYSNEELILSLRRLYFENKKLTNLLNEVNESHSIITLEQKMSMLNADYEDLQIQKDLEIDQLTKKLKKLKEERSKELATKKYMRQASPQFYDRLNHKASPKKLHQKPSVSGRPPKTTESARRSPKEIQKKTKKS